LIGERSEEGHRLSARLSPHDSVAGMYDGGQIEVADVDDIRHWVAQESADSRQSGV
jgi:hypothetical protein